MNFVVTRYLNVNNLKGTGRRAPDPTFTYTV